MPRVLFWNLKMATGQTAQSEPLTPLDPLTPLAPPVPVDGEHVFVLSDTGDEVRLQAVEEDDSEEEIEYESENLLSSGEDVLSSEGELEEAIYQELDGNEYDDSDTDELNHIEFRDGDDVSPYYEDFRDFEEGI